MQPISAKLRSQQGASIIIALVFFLLCLTVGVIVLTAATANAGRLQDQRQVQQRYLTVSSAAVLLQEQLAGLAFEAVTTTTTIEGQSSEPSPERSYIEPDETAPALAATICALARGIHNPPDTAATDDGNQKVSFSITARPQGQEPLSAVSVDLTMSGQEGSKYQLTATLYIAGEAGQRLNPLILTVPAATKSISSSQRQDTIDEPTGELITTLITTETTTVTWQPGAITKAVTNHE